MTLPGPLSQSEMGTVGLEPRSLTVGSLRLKGVGMGISEVPFPG